MRVILIILATALMAINAAAQQLPAPSTPPSATQGMAPRPQAPVGHRQPRMSDLPPELAHKEQSGQLAEPAPVDEDQLKICRGC